MTVQGRRLTLSQTNTRRSLWSRLDGQRAAAKPFNMSECIKSSITRMHSPHQHTLTTDADSLQFHPHSLAAKLTPWPHFLTRDPCSHSDSLHTLTLFTQTHITPTHSSCTCPCAGSPFPVPLPPSAQQSVLQWHEVLLHSSWRGCQRTPWGAGGP